MDPQPRIEARFGGFRSSAASTRRKGVKLLADALNRVDGGRLQGLELEFVGKTTPLWPPARILGLLSDSTKRALADVSFRTDLDQPQALAHLKRPGTLAIIPSLHDNSPNTIYECLEERIPFIVSNTGGAPELIALEDHDGVLFDPAPEALAGTLERLLVNGDVPAPPRRAFAAGTAADRWTEVLALHPQPKGDHRTSSETVDAVVVRRGSQDALLRCVAALEGQTHDRVETIVAGTRREGLEQGSAPYVVFLDEDDVPDPISSRRCSPPASRRMPTSSPAVSSSRTSFTSSPAIRTAWAP